MKNPIYNLTGFIRALAGTATLSLLMVGCATTPQSPAGSVEVREKLTRLESNPNLGSRAPVEIREAAAAVTAAEQPAPKDPALEAHRVYMADRMVEIAMAKASTRYAEDQRKDLDRQRSQARLDARTREADRAKNQTNMAKREAEASRASAAAAAANADRAAADAASNTKELKRQIDLLQAEATDRGLVLTLGNVLFATGKSDLKAGSVTSLDKLVAFLVEYPDRTVEIEGHTDDVGSNELNQTLSQNRAESVRSYLVQQGILIRRLTVAGMGETQPVAGNDTESGRQQNRRVEVIIANPKSAVPKAASS